MTYVISCAWVVGGIYNPHTNFGEFYCTGFALQTLQQKKEKNKKNNYENKNNRGTQEVMLLVPLIKILFI